MCVRRTARTSPPVRGFTGRYSSGPGVDGPVLPMVVCQGAPAKTRNHTCAVILATTGSESGKAGNRSTFGYFASRRRGVVATRSQVWQGQTPRLASQSRVEPTARVTIEGDTRDGIAPLATPAKREEVWARCQTLSRPHLGAGVGRRPPHRLDVEPPACAPESMLRTGCGPVCAARRRVHSRCASVTTRRRTTSVERNSWALSSFLGGLWRPCIGSFGAEGRRTVFLPTRRRGGFGHDNDGFSSRAIPTRDRQIH
jgi:hypothetical protein